MGSYGDGVTKFSDLKGLKVVDWEGTIIGKIKDLEINMINNSIQSIIVHQGFFKHDTKILVEYIEKFEKDMVFLKITPVTKLVGRMVFDFCGKEVGKIAEVVRVGETNVLKDIIVKTKIIVSKDRSGYDSEKPLPGEKSPAGEFRVSAESPLMTPSSDVDVSLHSTGTEVLKEEMTIPSKYIDSIGDHLTLKISKEELFSELF